MVKKTKDSVAELRKEIELLKFKLDTLKRKFDGHFHQMGGKLVES